LSSSTLPLREAGSAKSPLTGVSRVIESIRVTEMFNYATYPDKDAVYQIASGRTSLANPESIPVVKNDTPPAVAAARSGSVNAASTPSG
jgi:hypothetical protein